MLPDLIRRFTVLFFAALLGSVSATACANDDFFKGKRLTYIVATKPGGGYDTFARLIARHLVKHLPVQSVTVKNIPGAGHIIGARQLDAAKPDGLTIGTFNTGLVYIDPQEMGMDLRRLGWIGTADHEPRVFVVGTQSGFHNFTELKNSKSEILVASSGRASASHVEAVAIARVLGLRLKPVQGFSGTEGELAIMRGNVVGMLASYGSMRAFIEQGHGRVLFYVGEKPEGLGDVPALESLVTDDAGRKVAKLIAATAELGRLTAAPGGVPPDRLARLREAYRRTLADPELLREAQKLKLTIAPLGGDAVAGKINALPVDSAALAKDAR